MSQSVTYESLQKANLMNRAHTPDHLVREHILLNQQVTSKMTILDGYKYERARMSDICLRCPHHLKRFNDSQKFISFVLKVLESPFGNNMIVREADAFGLNEEQLESWFYVVDLFSNGICKQCAINIAVSFADVLHRFHQYRFHANYSNQTMSCICTALLQYPFVSKIYLRDSEIFKNIFSLFEMTLLCHHAVREGTYLDSDGLGASYTAISVFGNQLLRNSHLLKKSVFIDIDPSRIEYMMEYVPKEIHNQVTGAQDVSQCTALQKVSWFLSIIFVLHQESPSEWQAFKDKIKFIPWRNKIIETRTMSVVYLLTKGIFHADICTNLLKISDYKMQNTSNIGIIQRSIHKVWKMKLRDMECQYFKCKKRASNMDNDRLFVCKGCAVARYCSKKCQKKDWKFGKHNKICSLFRH